MNRTTIEWTDYTLNPVKGKCPMACDYCYARKIYDRFKWNPEVRYDPMVLNDIRRKLHFNKGYKIFVGSTMELFNPAWIKYWWIQEIIAFCAKFPQHTFQFLTKCPEYLDRLSPFTENCWVGGTATNTRTALETCLKLGDIQATVKFLSIEPFLNSINLPPELLKTCGIGWLIIGACTGSKTELLALVDRLEVGKEKSAFTLMPWGKKWTLQPPIEWVEEIVRACDKAGVRIFLKDNLIPILPPNTYKSPFHFSIHGIRQEIPDG